MSQPRRNSYCQQHSSVNEGETCTSRPPAPTSQEHYITTLPAFPPPIYSILTPTSRTTVYSHGFHRQNETGSDYSGETLQDSEEPSSSSWDTSTYVPSASPEPDHGPQYQPIRRRTTGSQRFNLALFLALIGITMGAIIWQQSR
jgi:hypothetical protein